MMTPEFFSRHYPYLYHMARAGSWKSIRKHGLLSTSALLDLFKVKEREQIESCRRPQSVRLSHLFLGTVVIRDNKPINDTKLAKCLRGMTIPEYYQKLNSHVFFWTDKDRLNRLLCGRAYRDTSHIVLTVDARAMLEAHSSKTVLTRINSGAIPYAPTPRGPDTFVPFADWPTDVKRSGALKTPVVECAVREGVRDIRDYVLRVDEVYRDSIVRTLYSRKSLASAPLLP